MRSGHACSNGSVNKSVTQFAQVLALIEHSQSAKVRLESKGVALPKLKGKKDTWAVKRASPGAYEDFEAAEAAMTYSFRGRSSAASKTHDVRLKSTRR